MLFLAYQKKSTNDLREDFKSQGTKEDALTEDLKGDLYHWRP